MQYWKKVDVEGWEDIVQRVLKASGVNIYSHQFFNTVSLKKLRKEVPELFTSLEIFGEINQVAVLATKRNTALHDDAIVQLDHIFDGRNVAKNYAKMLFPIMNTENTSTCFYDMSGIAPYNSPSEKVCARWDDSYLETIQPVTCVTVDGPTILRISKPHYVYVGDKTPRVTLSVGITPDLVNLLDG